MIDVDAERGVVPEHVVRAVDDVIARAYLAVHLGLEIDALARPNRTLKALGLPPRDSIAAQRVELRERVPQRKRIFVHRSVQEVDLECCVCGRVTHWLRVGYGSPYGPAACPEHSSKPLIHWKAA